MVRDITRHIGCRLDFRTSKTCYSKLIRNYEMELTVEMGLTLLSRGVQLLHVSIRRKFVNLPPLYSSTSSRVSITGLHMEAALRAAPRLCRLGRKPLIVLAIFLIALIPFFLLQLQPSERTALAETPEVLAVAHNNGPGLLKWIDPLVGTDGDGHVWLGSTVPNGMVKVGIDCGLSQRAWIPPSRAHHWHLTYPRVRHRRRSLVPEHGPHSALDNSAEVPSRERNGTHS
ncbi:hypothetical protein BC830DRAFT_121386 [Chytriomyces sp. MP71]|nr:hypothetical protein BC830DRAFT_121386 [Chytriomyces sp. MP71]